MKVGLIGFHSVGKTTLYRAAARGQAKGNVSAVPVPDPRFDRIVAQVRPKKATPASVTFHDDIDDAQGASPKMLSQRFLDAARKMDVLLHVVRAFDSPLVAYHAEVDALRDQTRVDEELVLLDLTLIENRLERLGKSTTARSPGSPDYLERVLFERLRDHVSEGRPVRTAPMDEAEETIVRNFQLLTAKPMVVCFNLGETEAAAPPPRVDARAGELTSSGTPAFVVCATIEDEIAQLDAADQPEFLASLGMGEPASARLIRAVYDALGLITFFTAGDNETRAWALRRGAHALKAAGTIHNDIAKGFIRAEVVAYRDYDEIGSLDAAYSAGKMRLEGKEYIVHDGDLLHIRNKA